MLQAQFDVDGGRRQGALALMAVLLQKPKP